ncbi:hypothetical protein D3C74_448360 [compost metagenome]
MNQDKIRVFLVHLLDDWPSNQMLATETNWELVISKQTADVFMNYIKATSRVTERQ